MNVSPTHLWMKIPKKTYALLIMHCFLDNIKNEDLLDLFSVPKILSHFAMSVRICQILYKNVSPH